MFFFALISIISTNAENIYGEHSWYSFDIPQHGVCTGFADLYYTSPCSQYYPSLGPQNPSTYCVYEYIACCCAHCLECTEPLPTDQPTSVPTPAPTLATLEPTLEPTLATLEPTVATLEPTQVTLEPTLATLEPTLATLEPTLATLEPTLATLEPTLATLEPTLATLEPTFEPTLATLEPTLATLEPTLATLEPTLATLEPTLATLEPTLATLEPTLATLEPTLATLEPTLATLEPTLATLEPTSATLEPTATTAATTVEEDDGLLEVSTQTLSATNTSDSGSISVSTEVLLSFVFVSFWILCCGGAWFYYKSRSMKNEKVVEKYATYIPERKSDTDEIEKISITVGSQFASVADADSSVIQMDVVAPEGTAPGTTPGETYYTPGEGEAAPTAPSRSLEPTHPGPFLDCASMDRSRVGTTSTVASMGTVHDSYFPEEESSMDLYEDTFEKIEHEGPVSSGTQQQWSAPRTSEGGMVTGFDAQSMMRKNVVEKVFDSYDLSFDAAVKQQKCAAVPLDPQLSPVFSSVPRQSTGKESSFRLFGDHRMSQAVDLPIAGLDEEDSMNNAVDLYNY